MLILSQDKTILMNLDHITRIKRTGGEIIEVYSKFFSTKGGLLATINAYVQPMMFEAPKVYEMPEYR